MDEYRNTNKYLLPPKTSNLKTLVLDLDETLVHSQFLEFSSPSDIIIKIEIEKEIYDIHVLVRPGVKEFLENMKNYYEIVIFTASISNYADILLNIIDQNGCAPYRLFREHCTFIDNIYVKDLQRLGRDLKDIIILDNSPLSYSFHPNNGLPILSWFEDKTDRELYNIIPILIFLSKVNDVREYIPKFVINNSISYLEVEKLFKKHGYSQEVIKNGYNHYIKNLIKIKKDENNNDNPNEKQNNSNEYNINIQIVQNNINNYNNIINERQTNEIKNKLIKYLNTGTTEPKGINKKKQITEKILKLKQKNIITNIDSSYNNKILNEEKKINKFHKRQNTLNINFNTKKLFQKDKDKEKNYKKINNINSKNKKNVKNIIHKLYNENVQINKSMNQIKNNTIIKKRKRVETPNNNLNTNTFFHNNKYNRISIQKNNITSNSKNKKRNNSNNSRLKLLLPIETSESNIIKRLSTITCNRRKSNNKKKSNVVNLLQKKNKKKSNSNNKIFFNKEESNISNSINYNQFNLDNDLNKQFKINDKISKPSHKKQSSYNENNFFLKIKNSLMKSHEIKTKRLTNKNDFLKNEIQKINNLNQINTISNINNFKSKLIKRNYGNFKKINLKKIEFVTKKDKKKLHIDIKNKNIENNINRLKLNENIFSLYKSLNKNKNGDNNIFNNISDKSLNDKNTYRRIYHQKTISHNFNSTRIINHILSSKNKINDKYKKIYHTKINSFRRNSKNEFNDIQEKIKQNKKEDSFLYIKNMFINKFFDYIHYTSDNINNNLKDINKKNSKNKEKKSVNKIHKNKNNS